MALPNSDIVGLPPTAGLLATHYFAVQNSVTGVTEKVPASVILATNDQDFSWVSNNVPGYSIDEVVTHGSKWWISLQNNNLGNVPQTPSLFWLEVNKSVTNFNPWVAGVFTDTVVFVTIKLAPPLAANERIDPTETFILRLATNVRPYVSATIFTEVALGDWEFVGGAQKRFVRADITGEGLVQHDIVSAKVATSNPFKKWVFGDIALGIVRGLAGTNALIEVFGSYGNQTNGVAPFPLTKGSPYYIQVNGSLGLTVTTSLALFAISTTQFVTVSQGGGGGGADMSRRTPFRFNSNLFTEQSLSFRGIITALTQGITNELLSVSYESRLDTVSVYTVHASIAALQAWINTNVSGTEVAGTKFWIKTLATYNVSAVGEAENILTYTAS